jgi:hypothetical protein
MDTSAYLPAIVPSITPPRNGETADRIFTILLSQARYIGRDPSGESQSAIFSIVIFCAELRHLTEWTNPSHTIADRLSTPVAKIHRAGNMDFPMQETIKTALLPYLSARDPQNLERPILVICPIIV